MSKDLLHVKGENLNDCLKSIYKQILQDGVLSAPRGIPVQEWNAPVVIDLEKHSHPWTFLPGRKINVAFAIAEVIWILAGRNDVEFVSYFNKNISQFSNDGKTFDGAYGHRIRRYPEFCPENDQLFIKDQMDQLEMVCYRLKQDGFSRQAVISLWDPSRDLKSGSKDYPCNNMCYFYLRDGVLDMSVIRRSNDMIWGLPYNQIQFYFIHAIMAGELNVKMGKYYEYVQNMHVYMDTYKTTLDHIQDTMHKPTENVEGIELDRRINLDQFKIFEDTFFRTFYQFKQEVLEDSDFNKIPILSEEMIVRGVPSYWARDIFFTCFGYIAKKSKLDRMYNSLTANVDPGIKWLLRDFYGENK